MRLLLPGILVFFHAHAVVGSGAVTASAVENAILVAVLDSLPVNGLRRAPGQRIEVDPRLFLPTDVLVNPADSMLNSNDPAEVQRREEVIKGGPPFPELARSTVPLNPGRFGQSRSLQPPTRSSMWSLSQRKGGWEVRDLKFIMDTMTCLKGC